MPRSSIVNSKKLSFNDMKFHGWLDEGRYYPSIEYYVERRQHGFCISVRVERVEFNLISAFLPFVLWMGIGFSFALQIGIYQLRSFVSDRFVLDFGSVNFDITTLNRYVLALCFDAFKTFDLRYWFFPW
ncbi:hypothetical protein RhiirA4_473062 [Rhizophagus irregularis]|uniref:Uncharacterized protein n=1 Tax=Rhizophagus irregularis TaxID=588596 RepID=A0A2I1H609_9GLOM|nr:hypothetical protein RhiirA4_473062 [Rhizophagus irregularis]